MLWAILLAEVELVAGLASIYSAVEECGGVPVRSVFDTRDLDGYYCVPAHECPLCKRGEKIIMPRNVHRSAINALVISGAIPVYVSPGTNKELGIPLGILSRSAVLSGHSVLRAA